MVVKNNTYLGIDIGGTSAKYAHINQNGSLYGKKSFSTGAQMTCEAFKSQLLAVTDDAASRGVQGIGVCSLGFVDTNTGDILGGTENMPVLKEFNIRELLRQRYPEIPVHLYNDVKAVAMGEQWLGAGRDCHNFFCITFGTGLGGALVLDGKVIDGAHSRAGEIAYLSYRNDKDYLEKTASTKYLVERAGELLLETDMDGFRFFDLVRKENHVCSGLFRDWTQRISRHIADLIIVLDLEKVIIGGGISDEKDILLPEIRNCVAKMLPVHFRDQCHIVAAECTNDAGMLGAVSRIIKEST